MNFGIDWVYFELKEKGYILDEEFEVENDIFRINEEFVFKRGAKIMFGILEYLRLVDANVEDFFSGSINFV